MSGTKRILGFATAVAVCVMGICMPSAAADMPMGLSGGAQYGNASIGFCAGGIQYIPQGISGIEPGLGLSFGGHLIDNTQPVRDYPSRNKAGYVVDNRSGGTSGYTVTLSLSAFDNGLEGASLTLYADEDGLVTGTPMAMHPPVFLGGQSAVRLEADGMSCVEIFRASSHGQDPAHVATGRWGANFAGELQVFSGTVRAGDAKAVMTWELTIA